MPKPGQRLLLWLLHHQQRGTHRTGGTYKLGNVTFVLEYDEADGDGQFVTLQSLSAAQPGTGEGHQILSLLCGMSDIFGVTLEIYARALNDRPPTTVRLIEFYKRHGFEITQDHGVEWDADPDAGEEPDHHGADMRRLPRDQR